ncbi:hypothetical protein K491DRAFT_678832 [Lophiostoma macrostomum CBS 122681]|uniref:Uncharacterized protein n=1 Tax=Lophiostoma macrostomum CBS 122681 TaxID=1314788 RepID=A0A6A6T9A2_9PLEO|nr:hypothetical protein K491DRAFT_678832 [Lophiostoma macrostomum CBS 122681]
MTAALAIIPQRQPALRPQESVSLPQRPKLHINTQQLRTFGKGSSLRLDTLSAVSPTARNTFSNAYEPAATSAVPALVRPSKPQLSIDSSWTKTSNSNPPSSTTPSSASTLSSAITSASSNDSATIRIPYKQPHNLTSILFNSPARQLLPRKMAPVRPLFPAEKRVSFATPLEEEITTSKYTMAHSDLQSSINSDSTISSIETPAASESESFSASLSITTSSPSSSDVPSSPSVAPPSEQSDSSAFSSLEGSPRPKGPRLGDKRDSSESDSDSCPETPVAGRRKRRRDWRWTLPTPPSDKSSSASTTSDATTSEDSN